jgi:hypothetical protein
MESLKFISDSLKISNIEEEIKNVNEYKLLNYSNHFGIKISETHQLSVLEFLFRFGPAGIFEILI